MTDEGKSVKIMEKKIWTSGRETNMRYCRNCGCPLSEGVRFCENCGVPAEGNGSDAVNNKMKAGDRSQDPGRRKTQDPPRMMHRPEELEGDWQQAWERKRLEEDSDRGFTPVQLVLLGITAAFLLVLIGFFVFWFWGRGSGSRSTGQTVGQAGDVQAESLQHDADESLIEILDNADGDRIEPQPRAETQPERDKNALSQTIQTKNTVQTEPEVQTEKPVQTEAPRQTEKSSQTGSPQQTETAGYLPQSSRTLLTETDVQEMTRDDLQMAINEIYARHGRKFSSESIQNYFENQSWYNGTVEPGEFSDSVFSETEAKNIQFLLERIEMQQ